MKVFLFKIMVWVCFLFCSEAKKRQARGLFWEKYDRPLLEFNSMYIAENLDKPLECEMCKAERAK